MNDMNGAGRHASFPLRVLSPAARALPARARAVMPVFMLLLLLPSIHAADIIGGTAQCTGSTIALATDFNSPIYAIIGLTIALVAIAYMAGSAYAKPEWTVWARSEGITLAWSIVLVGIILAAFGASCSLSNLMLGGQGLASVEGGGAFTTPAMRASHYMGNLLNDYGISIASQLVRSSINDQMNSLNYAYWSIPVFDGGGLAYSANQRAWATSKDLLADIYIPLMVSIMVQKLLMDIAIPGVFAVILPAAIMLRMLFLTRDVGNLLLALSFAVYFALPLTYVFFFDATAAVQQNLFTGSTPEQPFGSSFSLGYDSIIGDSMQRVGFMAPQAILARNLALVVTVSMTMALHKAFRGMVA